MTGYLYILKHGIGPGTIPNNVTILKEKDLPNYYTAVWLDRFLTTSEMDLYDIPYETEINDLLSWIDYCQTENGDDVVPCDSINACGDVMASKKIIASKMSDIDLLAREALECTTKDELSGVISGLDSLGLRKLYLHYMEMLRDDSLSVGYIASDLSDTLYHMFSGKINACGNVLASTEGLPTLREFNTAEWEELNDGSKRLQLGDLFVYFGTNKQWNASNPVYWYEIKVNGETVKESREYPVDNNGREKCYKAMQKAISKLLSNNIDACGSIKASTKPKYFANMVSADTYFRHPEEWGYEVQGYYDEDRRGLAESDWTEDIRMVNDLLNEYANKGYNLRIVNCYAGIIVDIDTDDWFDNFYPEGISEGELE